MTQDTELSFLQRLADIHRRSEKVTWRSTLREALEACAELIAAPAAALLLLDNQGRILSRLKYGEPQLAALEDLSESEAQAWLQDLERRTLTPVTRHGETLWLLAIPPHTRSPLGMMLFEGVPGLPPDVLKTGAALLTPILRLAHERQGVAANPTPIPASPADQETQWITRYNRLAQALQRLSRLTDPVETVTVLADMMLQALDSNRVGILTIVGGRELFIHYRLGLTENSLRLMPGLYQEALTHAESPFQGIVQVTDLQQRTDERGTLARLQDVHTLLLLPMSIAEDEVGLIVLCRDQVRPFSPAEMALGLTLASQTALVLQKGYLYQQEYAQRTLARSLSSAATALTKTLDLEQVLDLILEELAHIMPAEASNVMLVEAGELRSVRWRGYEAFGAEEAIRETRLPLNLPNIVQMRESGAPVVIADVTQNPYWVPTSASGWLRSYAGAPIFIDHEMVGVINLDSARPNAFTLEDALQLKAFADYAAIALRNARYYTQASRQARDLSLLHTLSEIFAQASSLAESAQRCAAHLRQAFNATLALITFPSERHAGAEAVGWSGMPGLTAQSLAEASLELEAELAFQEVALFPPELQERLPWPLPVAAVLHIPLINPNAQSGGIYLAWTSAHPPLTPEELALYTALGRQISTGLERLRLMDELHQRQAYLERLNAAISEINQAVGKEALAEAGLRQVMQVEGIEQGAVYLWDEEREWRLRLNKNSRGELIPLPDHFPVSRAPQVSLPLSMGGEIAGVLNLYGRGLRTLRPDTEQLLHAIAYQLSLALQRGQLTDHLQDQLRAVHALYEFSSALLNLTTVNDVLWIALRTACDLLDGVIAVSCYVPIPEGWKRERLYTAQKRGDWPRLWPEGELASPEEQALLADCARMHAMVRATSFELPKTLAKFQDIGAHQILYVPIALPQPHQPSTPVPGILALVFKQERDLLAYEISLLGSVVQQTTAALERLALYHATREAESRLRAILESSQDGLLLVGLTGSLDYINQAALRLLALPAEQQRWAGRHLAEVIWRIRRYAPALARWLLHKARHLTLDGEQGFEGGGEFTTADRRVLAVTRWGVFQDDQTPVGHVFYLRDMTHQKALEQMRDDLLHMVVHDLRNPLGVILNATMMLKDPALQGMEEELIDITLQNTERTLRMVNTILDIGKLESGLAQLSRQPVHLTDFLDSIEKIVRVSTKTFAFEVGVPPDLPPVWGEWGMIERVLQNLVDNAVKFISGTPARLRIAAQVMGEWVQVEVFNTGKPIPPETQAWLFEKFRPGKNEARGYGLGLAFCRLAVEAHGGRIWVENAPDGVSFKFTLPVAPLMAEKRDDTHTGQDHQHTDEHNPD